MLRALLVASTLGLSAALAACGGSSSYVGSPFATAPPRSTPSPTVLVRVSPEPKPTQVPAAATPVVETSVRGNIVPEVSGTPETSELRTLTSASCANGLLTLRTSKETVFAQLSCDLFANDQFDPLFKGKEIALVLGVAPDRYRIVIDAIDGAHAEFTPEAIWVQ
jgi:hypothetical protein